MHRLFVVLISVCLYSINPVSLLANDQECSALLTAPSGLANEPDPSLIMQIQTEVDARINTLTRDQILLPSELSVEFELNKEEFSTTSKTFTGGLDYTPTWVDPNNVPGWMNISAGMYPGNHIYPDGMKWISPGVLYMAWKSFNETTGLNVVVFTRLVGSQRAGYTATVDVLDAMYTSGSCGAYFCGIEDVRMEVHTNGAPMVTWRRYLGIGGQVTALYGAVWNGTCWGNPTGCGVMDLSGGLSAVVNGGSVGYDAGRGVFAVMWADTLARVWYREQCGPGSPTWCGRNGGAYDKVFDDLYKWFFNSSAGILRAVLEFDLAGKPHTVFAGEQIVNGQIQPAKPIHMVHKGGRWKGSYSEWFDILQARASALVDMAIDKLWGRVYIVGQWEMSGQPPMVWFTLSGPTTFKGLGGAAYDWVSAWRGYFPVVESDTTSRPHAVFMDPNVGSETVISRWNASWWGGYGSNTSNRRPTKVSTDQHGQWGAAFLKDPANKAHVAYTTCTATSPTCAVSEIRYTRER